MIYPKHLQTEMMISYIMLYFHAESPQLTTGCLIEVDGDVTKVNNTFNLKKKIFIPHAKTHSIAKLFL